MTKEKIFISEKRRKGRSGSIVKRPLSGRRGLKERILVKQNRGTGWQSIIIVLRELFVCSYGYGPLKSVTWASTPPGQIKLKRRKTEQTTFDLLCWHLQDSPSVIGRPAATLDKQYNTVLSRDSSFDHQT